MKKNITFILALLVLFPCLLSAKSLSVSETQAPDYLLSSPERLYLTDLLREEATRLLQPEKDWTVMSRESSIEASNVDYTVQAQISKFGSSLVISAELYEYSNNKLVASFTGKGSTVEDIEKIIKDHAPDFFKKILGTPTQSTEMPTTNPEPVDAQIPQEAMNIPPAIQEPIATTAPIQQSTDTFQPAVDTFQTLPETQYQESEVIGIAGTIQPNPQAAQQKTVVVAKAAKDTTPVTPKEKPVQNGYKRLWGGFTAGATYNDFHSTKFGLNNIKTKKNVSTTVNGADDLLNSFWGIGFKVGFSSMFIASPYFNIRGDLSIALRQGSGKSNPSVILSWEDDDSESQKSDLEIEYSATQWNIDIPLLARVSIPNAIYFEAGPMFSFNVYSKNKAEITDLYGTERYKEKGNLNAFEFDIATGIGISRHIGPSMFDIDLRLIIGMTRISDSKDSPKTWQGQLNVTFWFL